MKGKKRSQQCNILQNDRENNIENGPSVSVKTDVCDFEKSSLSEMSGIVGCGLWKECTTKEIKRETMYFSFRKSGWEGAERNVA